MGPGRTDLLKERMWVAFAAATLNDKGDGVDHVDPNPKDDYTGNDVGDKDNDVDVIDGLLKALIWVTSYFATATLIILPLIWITSVLMWIVGNAFFMLSAVKNHDSWQ